MYPNFNHAAVDPPPGVEHDPMERWIVLDNGVEEGRKHAPIAPFAIRALSRTGLSSALNESMWIPDYKTSKILKADTTDEWHSCNWPKTSTRVKLPIHTQDHETVFVWSGNFQHGLYGSDLPAVRSAGMVSMSCEALLDLLMDSSRVKEYNQLSLGRTDVMILQEELTGGPFGGITKVVNSASRPPLIRKNLEFDSILHARELEGKAGYKIVSRAVTPGEDSAGTPTTANNVLKSEILMGVTMILRIEGCDDKCWMINVNHIRSPMIPMMIAKKIGLSAAVNFIHDLRNCC